MIVLAALRSSRLAGIYLRFEAEMARTMQTMRRATGDETSNMVLRLPLKTARRSAPATGGVRRRCRHRTGTVALRDSRRYKRSTELLTRQLHFQRLVRKIMKDVLALQETAENYLVGLFEDTNLAIRARRDIMTPENFRLARGIRDERFSILQ